MKILFIGRTEWLYNSILQISGFDKYQIVGIITSKAAEDYKFNDKDFSLLANNLGVKFLYSSKLTKKNIIETFGNDIDIALSVNHANIISQEVIDLFKYGILNAHGGDLPKYRGNACSAWAIINGEKSVGLCIHKMVGGELDSGDIIVKKYYNIDHYTYIKDIYNFFEDNIPRLFLNSLELIEHDPDYFFEKQSKKKADISRCYPRNIEDGRINWNQKPELIHRLVRASSEPYKGAFTYFEGEKIIIWRSEILISDFKSIGTPGQFAEFDLDGNLNVITSKGKIKILEIEKNNKRGKPNTFFKSVRGRFKNAHYDI